MLWNRGPDIKEENDKLIVYSLMNLVLDRIGGFADLAEAEYSAFLKA